MATHVQDTTEHEIIPWSEKVWRKSKQEPLVPLGVLATAGALTMAILSFRKRQSWNMQYWMRARVAAQAFTVGAMVVYYYGTKPSEVEKTRHLDQVSTKREERESKDRQEFLTRLKGAEDQWKDDQSGDQTPVMEKTRQACPDINHAQTQPSSNPGSSWWKMGWFWGGSVKQSSSNTKDDKAT
ncbi:hypoxia induced protein conserved region-domain-containing protein [Scleroderma yunnanense]